MAVGSGIGGSLGFGEEVGTYGNFVPPTRWWEFDKESLIYTPKRKDGAALAAGVLVDRASQRHTISRDAGGSIDGMVFQKGMGLLLAHTMRSSAVPVQQGTTAAYKQTHVLGAGGGFGRSLCFQKGIPEVGGAVRPYNFRGGKVTSAKFSCQKDGFLMVAFGIAGRDVEETSTFTAPTYLLPNPEYAFEQCTVQVGAFGSEAVRGFVTGFDLTFTFPMAVDRMAADGTGLKGEPQQMGRTGIAGTIDTEFVDKTAFADMFAADTQQSLIIGFAGPLIGGAFSYGITFRVPAIRYNTGAPDVGGPGLVSPKLGFKGFYDDVNPPATIEYTSTDIAA